MPTIEENRRAWSEYDWGGRGDEWSETWGGTRTLWYGTLRPRLDAFLRNSDTILEIGPGFGRFTQFLKDHCHRLIVVDLAVRCIEACRERFRGESHIEYHANDGRSLPMLDPGTIDFVFSFDSLVHAEEDALRSYLGELTRILKPEGVGFLHHSNLAALGGDDTRVVERKNPHWRGSSVSAERFRSWCSEAGLSCVLQEVVNWGGPELSDCFSVIAAPGSSWQRPIRVVENRELMDEAARLRSIADRYSFPSPGGPSRG